VRTIGYHENAPKMKSIGSRNTSVVSPPPRTHVTGVRRARRLTRTGSRALMRMRSASSLAVLPACEPVRAGGWASMI
jgi:hypothetical protein